MYVYVFFHGFEYGVFKTVPGRSKESCVGICIKVVYAVASDVSCDWVYVSSGKEENRNVSVFVWLV